MKCCCFGHREISDDIYSVLSEVVEDLIISCGVKIFLTGGMGKTDELFASTVRKFKNKYPKIKLILIRPYSSDIEKERYIYRNIYDDVVLPDKIVGVHYRQAIPKRNEWMVLNSDFVITYVKSNKQFGGAYTAKRCAQKNNKIIFELNDMI